MIRLKHSVTFWIIPRIIILTLRVLFADKKFDFASQLSQIQFERGLYLIWSQYAFAFLWKQAASDWQ